jgi:hypothetical protein
MNGIARLGCLSPGQSLTTINHSLTVVSGGCLSRKIQHTVTTGNGMNGPENFVVVFSKV